jgi:hypothetical protein
MHHACNDNVCEKQFLTLRKNVNCRFLERRFAKYLSLLGNKQLSNSEYYITRNSVICLGQPVFLEQWLCYGLDDGGSIPDRGRKGTFYPRHSLQTGSGAQPAF